MNKYPAWLNVLVIAAVLAGCLFALPNIYGSVPAVQLANVAGGAVSEAQLEKYVTAVKDDDVTPEAAFIADGRAVMRFSSEPDQQKSAERLRARFSKEANIALTLAPKLPDWVRSLGLKPMTLGLDLRGGIYVLLEVDMETAIGKRMDSYEQDIDGRLRDDKIIHRVDRDGDRIIVRVRDAADLDRARQVVGEADSELVVVNGVDGKSLVVQMSEAQIRERQDFAIEQNMTTLRNRVDELGVAEPLVQRQGVNRIVVQLPGVQDPTELE